MRGLRPFFSFYGGKWRTALCYPPPLDGIPVVEPFAGSAGYSLRYPDREVLLYDLDPVIVGVWRYLFGVGEAEILSVPDVVESVDELRVWPEETRHLVGFWLNRAPSRPRRVPSAWMRSEIRPGSFWGDRVRRTIASQLGRIRHWRVECLSFSDVPDRRATWFVDPPYVLAGRHYVFGSDRLDYAALASFCRSRTGRVVVCEQTGADWLPFWPLREQRTTRRGHLSAEVVWTAGCEALRSG